MQVSILLGGSHEACTIDASKLNGYAEDREMLQSAMRPCALIIQLKYKGHRYDFAVPLRSNIGPSVPKKQFFALPPRSKTKPKHRHGVHYIKMFPVLRSWTHNYRIDGNVQATLYKAILDANEQQIIKDCQNYLTAYENGKIPSFATNIDLLLKKMKGMS